MALKEEKSWPSRLIGTLIYLESLALFGFFSMNSFPHFLKRLGGSVNPTYLVSGEVASILIAACLFVTARGIKLRRRKAWIFATVLQLFLTLNALIRSGLVFIQGHKSADYFLRAFSLSRLVLEIVILILLVRYRGVFKTIVDPLTTRQSIFFFFRNLIFVILLGLVIVYFDSKSFISPVNLVQAFEITLKGLVGISGPYLFESVRLQERLEFFLSGLGLLLA